VSLCVFRAPLGRIYEKLSHAGVDDGFALTELSIPVYYVIAP
jgi:hypothetical protein